MYSTSSTDSLKRTAAIPTSTIRCKEATVGTFNLRLLTTSAKEKAAENPETKTETAAEKAENSGAKEEKTKAETAEKKEEKTRAETAEKKEEKELPSEAEKSGTEEKTASADGEQ